MDPETEEQLGPNQPGELRLKSPNAFMVYFFFYIEHDHDHNHHSNIINFNLISGLL